MEGLNKRKAAALTPGDIPAQKISSGKKYFDQANTLITEEKISLALKKFIKSAKLGHIGGCLKAGKLIFQIKPEKEHLAIKYLKKAMEKTHGKAEQMLGFYCSDVDEAIDYYNKSIEQGNVKAKFYLGMLLMAKSPEESVHEEGYDLLSQAAREGITKAQVELGKLRYDGKGDIEQDFFVARDWFNRAADKGNVEVKYLLAKMYWTGEGGAIDVPKAMQYLIEGEKKGCKNCAKTLFSLYYKTDNKKAGEIAIKYAEKGEKWAFLEGAKALLNSEAPTSENVKKAMMYLHSVTGENKVFAQFAMAIYHCKQKTKNELNKAIKIYRKILKNSSTHDQDKLYVKYNLALIYMGDFKGGILNTAYGRTLLKEAAEGNFPQAMLRLAIAYLNKGHTNGSEIFELIKKAYDLGEKLATYSLGYCYRKGVGVEKNYKEAYTLNMLAIEQNYPETRTKYYAGLDYLYGQEVAIDVEKAKIYLIESKQDAALFHLGLIERMKRNFYHAVTLFKQAHSKGDIKATMYLANMYRTGNGIEQSRSQALWYYAQAARRGNSKAQMMVLLIGGNNKWKQ